MRLFFIIVVVCFCFSCKWGIELESKFRLQKGDWRMVIESPLGELPLLLEINLTDSTLSGSFNEGRSKKPFDRIECVEDSIFLQYGKVNFRFIICGSNSDSLRGSAYSPFNKTWYKAAAVFAEKYKFIASSRSFSEAIDGQWASFLGEKSGSIIFEEGATDLYAFTNLSPEMPSVLSGIKDYKSIKLSGISSNGFALLSAGMEESRLNGKVWNGLLLDWSAERRKND